MSRYPTWWPQHQPRPRLHPPRDFPAQPSQLPEQLLNSLASNSQHEEALTAIKEAVAIHRELASVHPDAFLPELARELDNLSWRLANVGRREEALTAVNEAVSLRRKLAAVLPDAFLPDLADSLNSLSNHLATTGERGEALTSIQESVALYRKLYAAQPAIFLPRLIGTLRNLSARLADLGLGNIEVIEEARVSATALKKRRPPPTRNRHPGGVRLGARRGGLVELDRY